MKTLSALSLTLFCWGVAVLLSSCDSKLPAEKQGSEPSTTPVQPDKPSVSKLHSVELQKIFLSAEGRGRTREESRLLGDRIRGELASGANFGALSAKYSEDAFAAHEGRANLLFDDLREGPFKDFAATSLQGEISELFSDAMGFTIAIILSRHAELPSLSDTSNTIKGRIQEAEQAGSGQPATRSESKSEGGEKSQPEADGRSR
ncbi:MAG: hypothetical protein CFE26_03245 [Verrucomicrobiales bacterium VVV1]|nr:MAG: hypothetical protein CFE26_03245 [Verrucomicrobiales bacterium VVV1]